MLALIVVWEIVAIIANNPLTLPTPSSVARALGNLTTNGGLWGPALVSARVFILGFAFALALGLPVGVLIASWRLAERTVHSWLIISWATPIIALLPLLVTWFGLTTVTQLIVVALSAFFPVVVNTQVGIEAVEKLLVDAARVFGASPAKVLFRVKLPGAMPMIAAGIQVAVGRAVLGVVVAELFVSSTGLGGKMSYYANYFQIADYFATLVVFVAFSVVVTEAADYVARRMTRFRG
jgi:NitT/TauT family transport system permease protein